MIDETEGPPEAPSEQPLEPSPAAGRDEPRGLAPRVRTWWRIGILLNALVPSAVLGAASWFAAFRGDWRAATGAALVPWLVAAIVAVRVPGRRYAAWRYQVTSDALRLDRGVMFRQESVVPFTRIQHVDTEQGPLERMLGLSRVTVHTASGTSSSLTIPGLAPADAEALRERLAQLAGAVEPL